MSLPDDVAEFLDKHPNSSAVVTAALRATMERAATTKAMLESVGFVSTEEGRAWARSVLHRPTEEQRAESRRYLEALEAGRLPEPR